MLMEADISVRHPVSHGEDLPPPEFGPLPSMEMVKPSRPVRRVAKILTLLFILMLLGLALAPWQQNLPGSGRVVALTPVERQQTVEAPVDGRILKWHVIEGTRVKEGDLIVETTDNDPLILERLRLERAALQDRLRQARERDLSLGDRIVGLEGSRQNALAAAAMRIQMADERVRQAERGLDAARATFETARLQIERQKQLNQRGLSSDRTLELAQLDYDKFRAELERAQAALNAARNDRAALEADRQKIETDFRASINDARASQASARSDIASVAASIQQLEVRIARQSTQQIRAPRDGVILRLLVQPGSEFLKAGDGVAILVPESSQTVVELWVNGNDMPLISPGNKVRLQFEGWPAVQFVGWPSVAVGTFGGIVTLVDATDNGQGKFRILVKPDPDDERWPSNRYLRQGVRANGWVLLNVVPLGFELWRQFNGFPPVIAMDEPGAGGKAKPEKSGAGKI